MTSREFWYLAAMIAAANAFIEPASAQLQFQTSASDEMTIIIASGEIEFTDDLSAFERIAQSSGAQVVTFDSIGGNPYKAMELGRLIRRHGLATIQLRAGECASACALAFLGGTWRAAMPGAIGVHKSSFSNTSGITTNDAVSSIQALTADMMIYISEMGADPSLLKLALQYDSDDMRYLSRREMEEYRVTTLSADSSATAPRAAAAPLPPRNSTATEATTSKFKIPNPTSGRVQHPGEHIDLKQTPLDDAPVVRRIANGTQVAILGRTDDWYRVRAAGVVGYAHTSWILVDQFEAAIPGVRRIQVKSFRRFENAKAFVEASSTPLAAYLTTSGWFAVTLREQVQDRAQGLKLLQRMKSRNLVPKDSLLTFGNTYVREVCCGS